MIQSPLEIKLQRDLNDLALKFIQAFDLTYTQKRANLNSPLIRWLDYRVRYVEPKPRQVIYSNRFPKLDLPLDIEEARIAFEQKIREGHDLNPYQGKGLTVCHDSSGEKHSRRTDQLFASLGVTHFHLSADLPRLKEYYAPRGEYQVFGVFDDHTFAFLDIVRHLKTEQYSDPDFLRIILETWPDALSKFELSHCVSGAETTTAEITRNWKYGCMMPITLNGKSYYEPGLGMSSDGISMKVNYILIQVLEGIRQLSELILVEPKFKDEALQEGVTEPDFTVSVSPRGFVVYETKSQVSFTLNVPKGLS